MKAETQQNPDVTAVDARPTGNPRLNVPSEQGSLHEGSCYYESLLGAADFWKLPYEGQALKTPTLQSVRRAQSTSLNRPKA